MAKARDSASGRNRGAWAHLLAAACGGKREHDVKAQLNYLYSHGDLHAGIGLPREVGQETRTKHSTTMENLFDDLRTIGMRLKDVRHLSRKHVVATVKHWYKLRQAPSTIQTKSSVVRRFLVLIGKADAMPRGSAWTEILQNEGINPADLKRTYIAQDSKAWAAAGVDARTKIEEVWADSPVCGAALMLQMISGQRVKESLANSPMTLDCGDFLRLLKGTKGGRKRDVRLAVTEEQFQYARAALERVKEVADKLPRKMLCLPGKNLKQMRRHFYYVMEKHGITMSGDGVVPHGLRHGFLQGRYEDISGLPAPVLREAPGLAYDQNEEAVAAAKKQVSEDAGHSRDASYYYTGNKIAMNKRAREEEQAVLTAVGDNPGIATAFDKAGVVTAWLVGRVAYGVRLDPGQALEVHVLLPATSAPTPVQSLQNEMEKALGRWVTVTASYDPLRRPEVGTEVILSRDRNSRRASDGCQNG